MGMISIRRAVFALLLVGSVSRAQPPQSYQDISFNSAAEKQFLDGVALFKNGKFAEAAGVFDELHRLKPVHQRSTASYLMLAKSWFELKKYEQSSLLLSEFLQRFPSSTYADDAHYTVGLDYMMAGRFDQAGEELLSALQGSEDEGLALRAQSLFEYLADGRLTAQGLDRLLGKPFKDSSRDLVRVKLAEKLETGGDIPGAKRVLYGIAGSVKGNPYRQRARDLLDRLERAAGVKIAVVLPLMEDAAANPVKSLASELLEGITFAVKEQGSRRPASPVTIEVRDSRRDSATALDVVRKVSASPEVIGIIGPVFSNAVATCAAAAQAAAIPMISPTATANGLAAMGTHVFQYHPDWATRGKALARYAVNHLGFSALAVLFCADAPESLAARSFCEEAQRLGARIIASESFPQGASDLREQFSRIRHGATEVEPMISFAGKTRADMAPILQAGADPAEVDSLIAHQDSIGIAKLLGSGWRHVADSLHLSFGAPDTIADNTDIAITAVQGIFAAVDNPEEIGVIGSQLSYFNIRAQILGNEEWYDPVQLEMHKQYVSGALFSSDYFTDARDSAYGRFEREFYAATGRRPTKYTVIGYDTMTMLLDLISGGATTREKLTSALAALDRYPAIHGRVTLSRGRVNSNVHILKYSEGTVKEIIELQVN